MESVAFSPDGAFLATGGCDATVKLWDLRTGALARTLKESRTYVASVSFSPDGALLASYSLSSDAVKLWDTREWTVRRSVPVADPRYSRGAILSPDGATIAIFGRTSEIVLADLRGRNRSRALKVDQASCGAFSPDGSVLIVGTSGSDRQGTLQFHDARSGKLQRTLSRFGSVFDLACSPDGALLVANCNGSELRLWDARSGEHRGSVFTQHRALANALAFSPDGRMLASGCYGDSVHLWETHALLREIDHPPGELQPARTLLGHRNIVIAVAFSNDGRLLGSGSTDDTARLWDVASGAELHTLTGHRGPVGFVAFARDGEFLTGASDETRYWNTRDGRLVRTGKADCVARSPDGGLLATATPAGSGTGYSLRVLDSGSGRELWQRALENFSLHAAAFSPDGRLLASDGLRGAIQLWNPHTGEPVRTLEGSDESVWALAFAPDGATLAAGCFDGVVKLWNPHTGELRSALYGTAGTPKAVAFSPDGRLLAIGDERVRLWDLAERRQLATLTGEDISVKKYGAEVAALAQQMVLARTYTIEAVAFSPDGRLVAGGCTDETVKIWDVAGLYGRIADH